MKLFYVGKRLDCVRRNPKTDSWLICKREITLDQAVLTFHNLSVLF